MRNSYFSTGLAALLAGTLTFAGEPSRLADIQPASDFMLINQAGKKVQLTDHKNKVLLISFIFTTCSGSCPATTHRMAQVQDALKERGLLDGDGVRLISITLDPKRDTPEALQRYMRLYDIDAKSWDFLTGEPEQVDRVVSAWGMWAKPAANGQLDHPSRIFLVDRQQRIREIYNLAFLKTPWVVEDIEALLKEDSGNEEKGR